MPDAPRQEDADRWAARVTRAVRDGSRPALAEIFDHCAETISGDVRRATGRDQTFALDCVQECFMRLADNPPVVDAHEALLAWLRTVALNCARNAIVAQRRRRMRELTAAEHWQHEQAEAQDTEALARILARLTADERTLLDLRIHRGMGVAAMAASLGMGTRRIESALRRALGRARAIAASDRLKEEG